MSVSTLSIILLIWITPGVLLFLYLLWVSRRTPPSQPGAKARPLSLASERSDEAELPAPKEASSRN